MVTGCGGGHGLVSTACPVVPAQANDVTAGIHIPAGLDALESEPQEPRPGGGGEVVQDYGTNPRRFAPEA